MNKCVSILLVLFAAQLALAYPEQEGEGPGRAPTDTEVSTAVIDDAAQGNEGLLLDQTEFVEPEGLAPVVEGPRVELPAGSRYQNPIYLGSRPVQDATFFPQIPREKIEEIFLLTPDGVVIKIFHIKNPGRQILALQPGFGASGLCFELTAQQLERAAQLDTFVLNYRGTARLPRQYLSRVLNRGVTDRNGITEVLGIDAPTLHRYIQNEYALNPRLSTQERTAIHEQLNTGYIVLGHSMGGMMIGHMLTDPALRAELTRAWRGVILLQSPETVGDLTANTRRLARMVLPLLPILKRNGIQAINAHSSAVTIANQVMLDGNPVMRRIVSAGLGGVVHLVRLMMGGIHTDQAIARDLFPRMAAHGLSLDLIEDMGRAALSPEGHFVDSRGVTLINPRVFPSNLNYLFIIGGLDSLVGRSGSFRYFSAVPSGTKKLIENPNINHVDPLMPTSPITDYVPFVGEFIQDPQGMVARGPIIEQINVQCNNLLTRAKMAIRKRFAVFRGL